MTSRGRMTSQWRYNAAGRHTTSPTGLYNGQVFMACNDCRVINGIISGRRRPQTARNAIVNIQQHTWKCLRLYMTAVTWRSLLSHVWYSRHSHTRPRHPAAAFFVTDLRLISITVARCVARETETQSAPLSLATPRNATQRNAQPQWK